ncbi:MAG: GIY-YIG nuclease family protein [bacterium]|nr:GIY-YIG nuclease family protein [bacterium]
MFYVYLIKVKLTNKLYFGSTNDLRRRIMEHTKTKGKIELIYYEAYKVEKDARLREYNLKYFGKAYGQLKRRISESLRAS